MSDLPITSIFNDGYIAEAYESYRRDPASVDESWRQFFRFAQSLGGAPAAGAGAADPALLRKTAGAASLVHAIRQFGHLGVAIDPLGTPPLGARELTPEFHGITEADLDAVPAAALGFDERFNTAADVVRMLRRRYQGAIGYQFAHLSDETERAWFRQMLREEQLTRALTPDEKKALLQRLTEVDGLERFLGRAYQGKKRFSIEGTDALVPMLDQAIVESAALGVKQTVIGMAHRGRLNVLTHVLGKPFRTLFEEFEGRHADTNSASDTGDVKYHMGYRGTRELPGGAKVDVTLVPNPSHLEVVNPVVAGYARALRRSLGDVLTVLVHGDAAFIGEGVVAESFNMSRLRGYEVGGTLHVIANNQVGFTTDPIDSRSTHYASDLAKGFDVPVLHVNADDAEACITAIRVGIAYRAKFRKDFVIDLVGYRRWGHNETDEPAYTQPELYAKIKQHPTPREVFAKRLVSEGVLTDAQVTEMDGAVAKRLESIYDEMKKTLDKDAAVHDSPEGPPAPPPPQVDTAVAADALHALNERLLTWPDGFNVHRTLQRVLGNRRKAMEQGGIDWGQAEALAFGSLLEQGTTVRITGQDVERGTFSHRQAVLHDSQDGKTFIPLQAVAAKGGALEIWNSPLSETAVVGFEYGFSLAAPDALVLWEAQFGDFANVAQPMFDQFLSADRAKWGQDTSLVLLLPHGYEGQGPEHSSARLERFLQLCAEGNMSVAYPSTAAQYFHVIRRQALRPADERRPLVLMQPKSMLRLPAATSAVADLASGTFRPVIDDPRFASNGAKGADRSAVKRVVFCTGKIYHDLAASEALGPAVALVRVEELYPWPGEEITRVLDSYAAADEVVWVQEEPMNMGAWTYAAPRLGVATGTARYPRYVGRPERASPAEGYEAAHKIEQARIVGEAVTLTSAGQAPSRKGKAKAAAK